MNKEDQYQALVEAFYQAIINPDDDNLLKGAITLASNFDRETVEDAKRETSVMSVTNIQFKA